MWLSSPPHWATRLCVPGQGLVPSTHNSRLLLPLCCFLHVRWISAFADAFACPKLALRRAKASSDSMGYVEKQSQKYCSTWC